MVAVLLAAGLPVKPRMGSPGTMAELALKRAAAAGRTAVS